MTARDAQDAGPVSLVWRRPPLARSGAGDAWSSNAPLRLAVAIWIVFVALEMAILPSVVGMSLVWAAHGFLLTLLLKHLLERAPRDKLRRVVVFVLAPIGIALLQTTLDVVLTRLIGRQMLAGEGLEPGPHFLLPIYVEAITVFKINLRSYLWIYSFYATAMAFITSAKAELDAREAMYSAELNALRLHVNPHFLFNALNALASLSGSGRNEQAQRMALGLSDYYRSTLGETDREFITLGEEIDNVEAYVEFERYRLTQLRLELDAPDDLESLFVPAFLLQPLIENAVKYGAAGEAAPVAIEVQVRRREETLRIRVRNGISSEPDPAGAGSGLAHLRKRLETLFSSAASLTTRAHSEFWEVELVLPATTSLPPQP